MSNKSLGRRVYRGVLAGAFLLAMCSTAFGGTVFQVYTSVGPNPYASPSFAGYATNVLSYLQGGPVSNTGGPADFNQTSTAPVTSLIQSDGLFNSWMGVAPPGGAFSGEYGNTIFFALSITQSDPLNVTGFYLSDIYETITSNEGSGVGPPSCPSGFFNDCGPNPLNSSSPYMVGIGIDGSTQYVGAGAIGSNQLSALYYVGLGVGVYPDPSEYGGTNQDTLNNVATDLAFMDGSQIQVCYSFPDPASNCGAVTLSAVPEPATLALFPLGLTALFVLRRFRKA